MQNHPLDEPIEVVPNDRRVRLVPVLRPFLIFCSVVTLVNCVLGYIHSRTLLGPQYSSGLQELLLIVIGGFGVAQCAIIFILGGIVFRHWVVGQSVAMLLAVLWICSGWCWHFAIFLAFDNTTNRFTELFGYVCLFPLVVLAGSCPLLVIRIGMCRARPKGISITELFAIVSFVASVLVTSALHWPDPELVEMLVFTALGSALTITPASLLYFTSSEQRGTQRFLVFAIIVGGMLFIFSLFTSSALLPIFLILWFALFVTISFIGLWCIRRSGLGIPISLQSPENCSTEESTNDQSQFIWVIAGTISIAFFINTIALMLDSK
jgi:hypothetical protein